MIDSYRFGSITIDNQRYTKDVIITHDGVTSPWWRGEGHNLMPEDLAAVVAASPQVLVIGTGSFGVMKVPDGTLEFSARQGY